MMHKHITEYRIYGCNLPSCHRYFNVCASLTRSGNQHSDPYTPYTRSLGVARQIFYSAVKLHHPTTGQLKCMHACCFYPPSVVRPARRAARSAASAFGMNAMN